MDFQLVFEKVISSFEKEGLQYGLIGGFALGVMGILRATMDIDTLLLADDLDKADKILTDCMYTSGKGKGLLIGNFSMSIFRSLVNKPCWPP